MKPISRTLSAVALSAVAGTAQAEVPQVVASIAPIHSLVAGVMAGVGEPHLVVPGNVSDHDYAMRPSDLRKIAGADLVVWVGPSLETYLDKPLRTEAVPALALLEAAGVEAHSYNQEHAAGDGAGGPATSRAGHGEDHHAHEAGHAHGEEHEHGHEHLGLDPHVWLDPIRAQAIVRAVAGRLAELDPEHAETYRRNAEASAAALGALDGELRRVLAPVSERPFVTFHDGYGYFVERYGLRQVGQLSIHPEQQTGAASVRALGEAVARQGVGCAFAEPQFDPGVVEALAGQAALKIGVLDAVGADLAPGPALYGELMRKNAAAMVACLASTS